MKPQPDDIAEAERLKLLPKAEQREIVGVIRSPADDPNVPETDRAEARRRGKVLTELLGLTDPARKRKKRHH